MEGFGLGASAGLAVRLRLKISVGSRSVEEEFSWTVVNGLRIFTPILTKLIEDAIRERLADPKIY